jgi:hypothetical protein
LANGGAWISIEHINNSHRVRWTRNSKVPCLDPVRKAKTRFNFTLPGSYSCFRGKCHVLRLMHH